MGRITLTLPWPAKALHSNARVHWSERSRSVKKARNDAQLVANNANIPCWPGATILIEYYPPTRRGDPQNVPTSLKAYIDGIADAMGCDDRHFKVDFPTVFAGTRKPAEVVFHIEMRGQVA